MSSSKVRYFQTTKKGELRQLCDELNSIDKNVIKKAVKKTIECMTVSKDVSMLFSDVIKSMGTDDVQLKKLVYLYINIYTNSQPEKAILVVGMLQKDSTNNPNPLFRSIALKTMGCINIDRITEYFTDPLNIGLMDQDAYVRKTGVIGVAKLYNVNKELVEERDFIDNLRKMISDVNPMVVGNAVAALTEICQISHIDYFRINNQLLYTLLAALNTCNEWGRVYILDALSMFPIKPIYSILLCNGYIRSLQILIPNSIICLCINYFVNTFNYNKITDICDKIVPQLSHSNSAVVMSSIKCVIKWMDILPNQFYIDKYCKILTNPLITLLSYPSEIQYVVLRNIQLIIQKYPNIFQNNIKSFFIKYDDIIYVKMEKLKVLSQLTSEQNVDQILLVLKQYALSIDIDFVKHSIQVIAEIALKLDTDTIAIAEKCVNVLCDLVKTKINYIIQETAVVIRNIFRKYPKKFINIAHIFCDNLQLITEPEAKASVIWIIGEYSKYINDASDRIKYFSDSIEDECFMVQLQLLTAVVKLFLKEPDKSKDLMKKVLKFAMDNAKNPDVRSRGFVYWRLLTTDLVAARKIVLADKPVISLEPISLSNDHLTSLLNNLSTLSSVYHKPLTTIIWKSVPDYESFSSEESSSSSSDYDSSDSDSTGSSSDDHKSLSKSDVKPVTFNMLFDSSKGNGLQMSCGFERKNNMATMIIKIENNGNDNIKRIDIKFNKNYLGIQPKTILLLNTEIKSNQSNIIDLQLQLSQDPIIEKALNTTVQMAIRACKIKDNNIKPVVRILMFDTKIPAQIFWSNNNSKVLKDKNSFVSEWKSIKQINEESEIIKQCKNTNCDVIKNLFSSNQCIFICDRQIKGRGVSLYFSTSLKRVSILLEISIANYGACRVVVKSSDKYLSYVSCKIGANIVNS